MTTAAAHKVNGLELPPKQRIAILQLVAAARRVFPKHYSVHAAKICGTYWAAYGTAFWLGFSSPVMRYALAVGGDPHTIAGTIAAYDRMADADPMIAQNAAAEFEAVYNRMRRRPFTLVGSD